MRRVLIEWLEFCSVLDSNCRTGCSTHLKKKAIEVLFRFFRPLLLSSSDHLIDLQNELADPCLGAAAGACVPKVRRESFKSKTLVIDTCMTFFPPTHMYSKSAPMAHPCPFGAVSLFCFGTGENISSLSQILWCTCNLLMFNPGLHWSVAVITGRPEGHRLSCSS